MSYFREKIQSSKESDIAIATSPLVLYSAVAAITTLSLGLATHTALLHHIHVAIFFTECGVILSMVTLLILFVVRHHHTIARLLVSFAYACLSLIALFLYGLESPHVPVLMMLTFITATFLLDSRIAAIVSGITIAGAVIIYIATAQRPPLLSATDKALLYGGSSVITLSLLLLYRHQHFKSVRENFRQELIKIHRFSFFGEIAAASAHDISNRLCLVQLILDDIKNTENTKNKGSIAKNLTQLEHNIQYINNVMRKTKQHITSDYNAFTKFNALETIQHVVDEAYKRSPNSRVLLLQHASDKHQDAIVTGHSFALHHILSIIITNALESYQNTAQTPQILISVSHNKYYLNISIADNGSGLPRHIKQHPFSLLHESAPKDTAKNISKNSGGMGIGLYLAEELSKTYFNTHLRVSSGKKGTRFTVRLPTMQQALLNTPKAHQRIHQ